MQSFSIDKAKYNNAKLLFKIFNNIIKQIEYILKFKIIKFNRFDIKTKLYIIYIREEKFNK